ncbi:MAG: hypothetical protein L0Z50_39590 [Verrucomicrobiales bacterium]|nr:hypothetical protein [Verrucomicrobiales bacterium]
MNSSDSPKPSRREFMTALGLTTLAGRRNGDREEVRIARRLRKETTIALDWIAPRLNMGTARYAAQCLRQVQ